MAEPGDNTDDGGADDRGAQDRGAERVTINKEFGSFDAFVSEYVANVSTTGVFIRTNEPLAVGTAVDLSFTVLMDGFETVSGEGEVVRVVEDPPGMGVVFTTLSSTSQAIIARLLTAKKSDGNQES